MTKTATLLNKGLTINIGGVDVTFKPLPISEDLEWRRGVGKVIADVVKKQQMSDDKVQSELLAYIFAEGLDELMESIFLLADKPIETIMEDASRQELTAAMVEVFQAYYIPFVSSIVSIWVTMRPTNG